MSPDRDEFLAITRAMLADLNPDSIFRTLIDFVKKRNGVSAVAVWEHDEADALLKLRHSAGLSENEPRTIALPSDSMLVNRVLQSEADLVSVTDLATDPLFSALVPTPRAEGAHTVAVIPLVTDDRLSGMLVVSYAPSFTPSDRDADTLRMLANLASLALENAHLFRKQISQLEELNTQLTQQSEVLSQSLQIRDWLLQTALAQEGFDSVAHNLAVFAHRTVLIEDEWLNQLCLCPFHTDTTTSDSSNIEIGLRPYRENSWVQQHLTRALIERRPALLPSIPEIGLDTPRIVAPILTGQKLLGYISLLEQKRPFDTLDYVLAEQGAVAVALGMTKRKVESEVDRKARSNLLQSLLTGEAESLGHTSLIIGRSEFNIRAQQRVMLISLDLDATRENESIRRAASATMRSSGYALVERLVTDLYPKSFMMATNTSIAILLGADQKISNSDAHQFGVKIVSMLHDHLAPATVSIGIGERCEDPKFLHRQMHRSLDEATKALEFSRGLGKKGAVTSFSELGIYSTLLRQHNMAEVQKFVGKYVAPLAEYDSTQSAELIRTLTSYIQNNYHLDDTAKALVVHPKTVKYRLQKIEGLCGIKLSDAESLVNIQIALRLHELMTK